MVFFRYAKIVIFSLLLIIGLFVVPIYADTNQNVSDQTNQSIGTNTSLTLSPHPAIITLNRSAESTRINSTLWITNSSYSGPIQYPLMQISEAEMAEMNNHVLASARIAMAGETMPVATGSKTLLSNFTYNIPAERNQGSCGNCWVWASTGALEIDHAVKNGVYDRLSIQYFNSKFNNGATACNGGNLEMFTTWYASDHTPIPWSNTNAGYGDAHTGDNPSVVPISSISTTPHYQLKSLSNYYISTSAGSQATAMNAIKTQLNANKAVVYMYFYGTEGWDDFFNFWANGNENQLFDPVPHNGEIRTGGHAVLIVGYNDTDTNPDNHYWVVLNSWGNPSKRPNGIFRQKMNMTYTSVTYSGSQQHYFQYLDSNFDTAPTISGITPSSALNSISVSITELAGMNFYGIPTVKLNRTGYSDIAANDVTVVSPANITCTFNLSGRSAGGYNVVVTNPDGQQAMLTNGFTVTSTAPVAEFSGSPSNGVAPLTVTFIDLSTNGPDTWNWDFGDGNATNATVQNPVHTYMTGGLYIVSLNVSNPGGSNIMTKVGYINVTNGTSKIGVVRNNKTWLLDASGNGAWGSGDLQYTSFGQAGDVYVTGDWTGDGITKIGVVRNNKTWLLDASGNGAWGSGDLQYTSFGQAGDVYVTGDWTGDGITKIGVVRNNKTWLLDVSGNGAWSTGDLQYTSFGQARDVYVTGDWTGDGITKIGVVRNNNTWLLDTSGNGAWGPGDYQYTFGKAGDRYVTGQWN
jgi:PKD repeat protein